MLCQVDEELDELISRIKLEDGNTEFWKRRFLGEGLNDAHGKTIDVSLSETEKSEEGDEEEDEEDDDDGEGDDDVVEAGAKDVEDEEAEEEEEEVEQIESPEQDRVKLKEKEAKKPLQMIGVQLLKDPEQTPSSSKKLRRRARASLEV